LVTNATIKPLISGVVLATKLPEASVVHARDSTWNPPALLMLATYDSAAYADDIRHMEIRMVRNTLFMVFSFYYF
jgi:hypothetical protein